MIQIPMTWKDSNHIKNHFVGSCQNNEGETIITYRWWNRIKQRWQYKAETAIDLEYSLKISAEIAS